MKKKSIIAVAVLLCLALFSTYGQTQEASTTVKCIWNTSKHCAFTSIAEFNGKYYVSFREADSHIQDNDGVARGAVRILASNDGDTWTSVAYLTKSGYDLRDPKLSVTPDGRLMVTIGGSIYNGSTLMGRVPQVSFSKDGKTFSAPQDAVIDSETKNGTDWIWRVAWRGKTGYAVMYSLLASDPKSVKKGAALCLLETTDGINYKQRTVIDLPDFPNETTVRPLGMYGGKMAMMVRGDSNVGNKMGLWGTSRPPFKKWTFRDMGMQIGGPDFIMLDRETVIAGTRKYLSGSIYQTVLLKGTPEGNFTEVMAFPSGGDTSYPGFVIVGSELWVVYYSSHESAKASIYLAKVPLSKFK